MHKKYAADGLVAISVCLDNPNDAETLGRVNAFLQKKEAALINVIAEGDPDDWYNKLKVGSLPLVYVFDRENRRVEKLVEKDVNYEAIEAKVKQLLKK